MASSATILLLNDYVVLPNDHILLKEVHYFLLFDFERQAPDLEALVTVSTARVVVNYVLYVEVISGIYCLSKSLCCICRSGLGIYFNVELLLQMHGNLVVSVRISLARSSSYTWVTITTIISLPAVLTPHSSSTTFTSSSTTLTSSSTYELARIKSSTSSTTTALT